MVDFSKFGSQRLRLSVGGAALLALGAAGGAAAVGATRPAVEMAPAQAVAIASLPQRDGLVTVKGRVAEVYGDRFTVADATGKTMVDAGREAGTMTSGAPVMIQGRYRDGQLRASFVVDANGKVEAVGPRGHRPPSPGDRPGPRGPGGPEGPRGGPDEDRAAPPPPAAGCAPAPVAAPAAAAPAAK